VRGPHVVVSSRKELDKLWDAFNMVYLADVLIGVVYKGFYMGCQFILINIFIN